MVIKIHQNSDQLKILVSFFDFCNIVAYVVPQPNTSDHTSLVGDTFYLQALIITGRQDKPKS